MATTQNANSANPKEIPRSSQLHGLKFIRKSDLNQDFLESKSVISIKGENDYEYRFAKNNKESCKTIPQARENALEIGHQIQTGSQSALKENMKTA